MVKIRQKIIKQRVSIKQTRGVNQADMPFCISQNMGTNRSRMESITQNHRILIESQKIRIQCITYFYFLIRQGYFRDIQTVSIYIDYGKSF